MRVDAAEIQRLMMGVRLSDLVGQRVDWDKRKSRPQRGDWWACCPFHGERNPSFHVEDRKGFYHCFACGVTGNHIDWLRWSEGLTFHAALRRLGGDGPPPDAAELARLRAEWERKVKALERRKALEDADSRAAAWSIWKRRQSIAGTIGETYLRSRGYDGDLTLYKAIGFIPALSYPKEEGGTFPCIVAAVTDATQRFMAVWRIFLSPQGTKAPVADPKLGKAPCIGGAVWLGEPGPRIQTCEGLETGLSLRAMHQRREPVAVCLSTSGLRNFVPPSIVKSVLNFPDGDLDKLREIQGIERFVESPGYAASQDHVANMKALGLKAAMQPIPKDKSDFADIWKYARGAG